MCVDGVDAANLDLLKEIESNQAALFCVTFGFVGTIFTIWMIVDAVTGRGVLQALLGMLGISGGSHLSTTTNQAVQSRSAAYQRLSTVGQRFAGARPRAIASAARRRAAALSNAKRPGLLRASR
jgi:hypothetical protein